MLALYFGWDARHLEAMPVEDVLHYMSAADQLWKRDNRFARSGDDG